MLDKRKVKKRFEKSIHSYDHAASIQREVSKKLFDLVKEKKGIEFDKIFEIGCGTGFLTDLLAQNFVHEEYIINDLTNKVKPFIDDIFQRSGKTPPLYLFGDAEKLNTEDIYDIVISSSTFQWIIDLRSFFTNLNHRLRPGGVLAFSTYGPENFKEIAELKAGLSYRNMQMIMTTLKEANFSILFSEETFDSLHFGSKKELFEHIKATGVTGGQAPEYISKIKKWLSSSDEEKVSLTYHPMYFIAQKN